MYRRFFLCLSFVTCLIGMAFLLYSAGPDAKAGSFAFSAEPTWGADIKVNPSPTATTFVVENLSMAVNRANPNLLLAGYTTSEITNGSGYAFSTNSGVAWSGGEFTGPWNGNEPMNPAGDVRVAFDGRGVGYYSSIASGANSNGYFVLTTTDGIAWNTPVPVMQWDFSHNRVDSDLAVDQRLSGPNAGRVYMTWRREGPNNPTDEGLQ